MKLLKKAIICCALLRTRWNANRLNFKAAIREAEERKERCYVYFLGGKYRVYNRKQIQRLKNAGTIKYHLDLEKLKGIQLYDSQGHLNSHPQYTNVEIKGINIIYQRATTCTSK